MKLHLLKKAATVLLTLLTFAVMLSCAYEAPDGHIEISDPKTGSDISTAADLIAFFETGTANTATLAVSIDLQDQMLNLSAERGAVTINGNGMTLSGAGDCVIRLNDNASLTLNDITISGTTDGIGCLGSASIGGTNVLISGFAHAVHCGNRLTVTQGALLELTGNAGSGIKASSLELCQDAHVNAVGGESAVNITKYDITLNSGAYLEASTANNYNAVKCTGELVLMNASTFFVSNSGDYHGAEIGSLRIDGDVTVKAQGGDKGVGLFFFRLDNDYEVSGYCKPDLRCETGKGSITFKETEDS